MIVENRFSVEIEKDYKLLNSALKYANLLDQIEVFAFPKDFQKVIQESKQE